MWISHKYTCGPFLLNLPPTPHPSRLLQTIRLSSLCYNATSHELHILYTEVYICQCYSLSSPHPLLPHLCQQVFSLCLHLYSCPETRFISTIFLDSIYMHEYIFDFLFLTYFTLYDRLWIHPHHYKWLIFTLFYG